MCQTKVITSLNLPSFFNIVKVASDNIGSILPPFCWKRPVQTSFGLGINLYYWGRSKPLSLEIWKLCPLSVCLMITAEKKIWGTWQLCEYIWLLQVKFHTYWKRLAANPFVALFCVIILKRNTDEQPSLQISWWFLFANCTKFLSFKLTWELQKISKMCRTIPYNT